MSPSNQINFHYFIANQRAIATWLFTGNYPLDTKYPPINNQAHKRLFVERSQFEK